MLCFRLKEQRDRLEREHLEEVEFHTKTTQELKNKIENLEQELSEKQVSFVHHTLPSFSIVYLCNVISEASFNIIRLGFLSLKDKS